MDAWTDEEESPFKGLPPLPRVFREPRLCPASLPDKGGQEEVKPLAGSCSSLQDRMTWLHSELLRLHLEDLALFHQLSNLALEIQDLKELQQEMESFSKEESLADEAGQAGTINSAAAFELTI